MGVDVKLPWLPLLGAGGVLAGRVAAVNITEGILILLSADVVVVEPHFREVRDWVSEVRDSPGVSHLRSGEIREGFGPDAWGTKVIRLHIWVVLDELHGSERAKSGTEAVSGGFYAGSRVKSPQVVDLSFDLWPGSH